MSFNFIFDMIERTKQCRDPLKLRRERSKDAIKDRLDRKLRPKQPDISLARIEAILKESKEWEEKEQRSYFRLALRFLGIIVITLLVIGVICILMLWK
ncbi:hypothetical protein [Phocaeicola sp.]